MNHALTRGASMAPRTKPESGQNSRLFTGAGVSKAVNSSPSSEVGLHSLTHDASAAATSSSWTLLPGRTLRARTGRPLSRSRTQTGRRDRKSNTRTTPWSSPTAQRMPSDDTASVVKAASVTGKHTADASVRKSHASSTPPSPTAASSGQRGTKARSATPLSPHEVTSGFMKHPSSKSIR